MVIKKKLNISLKKYGLALKMAILFMLVLCLQMISSPNCYATDYTDFEIPIEFWQAFKEYINTTITNYRYGGSTTATAEQLKFNYDNNIKDNLKTLFLNNNADERNLMLCINNSLNDTYVSRLRIYYIFSNNGVNNIENTTSFYVTGSGGTPSNAIAMTPYSSLSPNIYRTDITADGIMNNYLVDSFYASNSNFYWYDGIIDYSSSTLLSGPWFGCTSKPLNTVRFKPKGQGAYNSFHLENYYDINPVEPEPVEPSGDVSPSGDVPVTPSGEGGGSGTPIDYTNQLNNINNNIIGITNQISGDTTKILDNQNQNTQTIVNSISGETTKITNTLTEDASDTIDSTNITSGDFANIVDFTPITNNQEYTAISNLWFELLNGFSDSLTNVNRILFIEFRGQHFEINLDNFSVFIPSTLKVFFGTLSTVFVVIYISKNTKHLIEDIQTASIDNVANKLTDDFESNMF